MCSCQRILLILFIFTQQRIKCLKIQGDPEDTMMKNVNSRKKYLYKTAKCLCRSLWKVEGEEISCMLHQLCGFLDLYQGNYTSTLCPKLTSSQQFEIGMHIFKPVLISCSNFVAFQAGYFCAILKNFERKLISKSHIRACK